MEPNSDPAKPATDEMMTAGLNLIQQALTIYDHALSLVVCNHRFREMFDLPRRYTTPGASFADTIRYLAERGDYGVIDDLEAFVAARVRQAKAFEPHYMERTRANGHTISVEGSPLPQGGWVTVYTDITRMKRQEQLLRTRSAELSDQLIAYSEDLSAANRELSATITALEEAKRQISEAEARLRLTAEMTPAHIAHVGRDQRYTYSNRRLANVMPGSKAGIVGKDIADVLGEQPFQAIAPHLNRAFEGDPSVFEFTHAPSSRRIRVALTPDDITGGVYILSMDVTEETQTRAALQQTRRRELAAQMTNGLAHDFSNLLTIILGMQSRLARMELSSEASELISATQSAARRGGDLLNRIAGMTGHREHAPVPVKLRSVLDELEPLARSTLPDGVALELSDLTGGQSALLDTGMLQDSLLNLILNARDACGPVGRIALTARTVRGTWIDFNVTDSGSGFAPEVLAQAITPFFTTKGGEGSGLGLSMVYDMTKLAGGRIEIGNHEQGGGSVTIRLPLRPALETAEPGLILLVEDSPDLRLTIRDMLVQIGHAVLEATTVDEAIDLLGDVPSITGVLSDITLAGNKTGLDLWRALPEATMPFIFMTSLAPDHPNHMAAAKLTQVLRKPFSEGQLHRIFPAGSPT